MKEDEVEMEVFRSGNYGSKGTYCESDLQQMADDYRPDLLEAPLTFDHAQAGPAYGWVSRLRRKGDRLVAVLKGVPDAVRELVRSGAYKRRSVELFQKLPQTGRPYLRAVSLLGAATPEVKGLRDICFAAATECCAVQFADDLAAQNETLADTQKQRRCDAGAATDKQVAELRQQVREAHFAVLFSELRADGYCLGERDAHALRQLFASVDADATVHFDDGTAQPGLDWLAEFLRQGLLRVPKDQTPAAELQQRLAPAETAQFSRFSQRTDPQSLCLHQRALAIQNESPGFSYRDALSLASREG